MTRFKIKSIYSKVELTDRLLPRDQVVSLYSEIGRKSLGTPRGRELSTSLSSLASRDPARRTNISFDRVANSVTRRIVRERGTGAALNKRLIVW